MAESSATDAIDRRILEAAEQLFIQYGFDKTTLNDVVQAAGIARSTLYARYKRKEALFVRLLYLNLLDLVEDWLVLVEADPKGGTFAGIFKNALMVIYTKPFILALYRNDRQVMGSFMDQFETGDFYEQRLALNHHFLSQLQQIGVVRADLDVGAFAYIANCLNYGVLKMSDMMPPSASPSTERILTMLAETVERTVAPEGGGNSEAGKQLLREYMQVIRQALDQFEQQFAAKMQDTNEGK